jgi:hypothetical protein
MCRLVTHRQTNGARTLPPLAGAARAAQASPGPEARTAGTTSWLPSRARGAVLPVVQRPADGGDRGASDRSRLSPLPVRQWVLSVPKRLRWYLGREPRAISAVLHILLRVIEAHLRQGSGAGAPARFGAVSFIHRFGAALNRHVHNDENLPGSRASRALAAPASGGLVIAASSTGCWSRSRMPVMSRNPCAFAPPLS